MHFINNGKINSSGKICIYEVTVKKKKSDRKTKVCALIWVLERMWLRKKIQMTLGQKSFRWRYLDFFKIKISKSQQNYFEMRYTNDFMMSQYN